MLKTLGQMSTQANYLVCTYTHEYLVVVHPNGPKALNRRSRATYTNPKSYDCRGTWKEPYKIAAMKLIVFAMVTSLLVDETYLSINCMRSTLLTVTCNIPLLEEWSQKETNTLCGIVFCFLGFQMSPEGRVVMHPLLRHNPNNAQS